MSRPIISKEQLIKAAGAACFDAAEKALPKIKIYEFQYSQDRISALIGTHSTHVRYRGEHVEGECDCEQSDGFDFCEHCVQLTLHANKVAQQLTSLAKGPDKSKVLAYLINLDKQVLAKQFLDLLDDNPEQFQRYVLKASIDQKGIDYTELKSQLTQLTRLKEKLFSQRQVKHFFARIEQFISELDAIPHEGHEDKRLKLIEYAFQRINKLLDEIEDRADQKHAMVEKLNAQYQHLFSTLHGRPETLAKRYFALWMSDHHKLLSAPNESGFSPLVLDAFQKLAKQKWSDNSLKKPSRQRLSLYLKGVAEHEGNLEEEQCYRTALAETEDDWLKVAQVWLNNGKTERAINILEEWLQKAEDKTKFVTSLLFAYQNLSDPLPHLKKLFCVNPEMVADTLFAYAEDSQSLNELERFAITILEERDRQTEQSLLISLLLKQNKLEQALQIAHHPHIPIASLIELARAIRDTHPQDSLEVYQQALTQMLEKQLSKHDRHAAELLLEIETHLSQKTNLNAMLDDLQPLLRSRPNVIKLVRNLQL